MLKAIGPKKGKTRFWLLALKGAKSKYLSSNISLGANQNDNRVCDLRVCFFYIFSDLVAEKTGQKENPPRFALRAGSVTNPLPAMKM